jgi:hypothetical protein
MNLTETLTTVETSAPGERYALFDHGPNLSLHLAAPTVYGMGPCICGFDRFARDIGFSVGGGVTGPGVKHTVCQECARLIDGRPIKGTNASLFENGI